MSTVDPAPEPVRVFVSYSHKDPAYLADDSLLGSLKGLSAEGVEFWTDERIAAASFWNEEIRKQLESCDIALVLVSQAFLDSPFCTQIEIGSFLESCRQRGLLIFPVVLSACEWERHDWLASRQFLPGGGETIEEHYTEPGKRKRLFWRIRQELRKAVESVRNARAAVAPAAAPAAAGFAEKRQVTFVRCDLLPREPDGSPLDPADANEVLHELRPEFDKVAAELFARYQGFVASTGSGGTLVCFGFPEVAEDDSRRAVRAGLELVTAITALSTRFEREMGVALATRVAVHTGTVVISPGQDGEDLSRGDVPMTSLYLQQEAAPNTVVISAATLRLVEPFFEVEPAGSMRMPGGTVPVAYSRIVADKGFETRFEAAASRTLTPIVGREKEMALLLDRWQSARAGAGAVVMLSGDEGVGKSRLLKQVHTALADEPHTWLEWHGLSYYRDTALHPVVDAIKETLGITHDMADAEKRKRLTEALALFRGEGDDLLPLLAPVLSIPLPTPSAYTPQEQKELTLQGLAGLVALTAQDRPTVLAIEDLHLIDPTTTELIELLIREAAGLPLLILLTYPTEYTPPPGWLTEGASQLALGKLNRAQVDEMVLHLTGGKALPAAVSDEIYAKTDGFPLFVEDLTRMVIESDLLQERNGAYELVGPFQSLAIPATLTETIMARLARLATAKPIAQLGATIGREFVYDMLRAVASVDDVNLKQELDRLVAAGLLFRRGVLSKAKYVFKSALVQEALHESLLKRQRRQYHKLVAEVLEEKFPDVVRQEPELVARHFAEADIGDKAAAYYLAAAKHGLAASANLEVLGHVANALTMLERQPDSDQRAKLELEIRCVQGNALVAMRGWAGDETGACYQRARTLCNRLPAAPQLSQVLKGLSVYQHTSARLIEACATADEMHRKATAEENLPLQLEALGALCCTHFWRGRFEEAAAYGYEGLEVYDPSVHHVQHITRFGEDPGALLYTFTAMSLAVLGREEQAQRINEQALLDYDVYTHIHSQCYLLAGVMFTHLQRRDPQRVLELSAKLLAIANEHRFPGWIGIATPMRGWALTMLGETEQGLAMIKAGREGWRATGGRLHASQYPSLLAESYLASAQYDEAAEWLRIGLADAAECTEGYYLSEPWRLKGELAVLTGRPRAEAEACYARSLEIAREQEALTFELRTEVSLCELLARDGAAAARTRLAAVMDRFTEGFDSWDMRRASALRDRLTDD